MKVPVPLYGEDKTYIAMTCEQLQLVAQCLDYRASEVVYQVWRDVVDALHETCIEL